MCANLNMFMNNNKKKKFISVVNVFLFFLFFSNLKFKADIKSTKTILLLEIFIYTTRKKGLHRFQVEN